MLLPKESLQSRPSRGPLWLRKLRYRFTGIIPLIIVVSAIAGIYLLVRQLDPTKSGVEPGPTGMAPAEPELVPDAEAVLSYETVFREWQRRGEASREEIRESMAEFASLGADSVGPAGAHVWMAKDLIKTAPKDIPLRRLAMEEKAERHLREAIAIDPASLEAYQELAGLLVRRDRTDDAIRLLEKAVPRLPGLGLTVASLLDTRGDSDRARTYAEKAAAYWRPLVEADPGNVTARIQLAGAEMLLGNDRGVAKLLERDRSQDEAGSSEYVNLEVAFRLRQTIRALRASPRRIDEALDRLEEALDIDPDNFSAINWLGDLGVNLPEARLRVRSILGRLASRSDAVWKVHFALGVQYLPEEDFASARPHFERAHAMNQEDPRIANNLAWCLANTAPPQLEKALELVDGVMKADADVAQDPVYIDTRGQILVKMGVRDLEIALKSQKGEARRGTNLLLVEAYEALGKIDQAQEARQAAERRPTAQVR